MELACEDINNDFYSMWDSNTHNKEMLLKSLNNVRLEAKDAETTVSKLTPHIQGLHDKLLEARVLLSRSNARQWPEMKKLLFQLEALQLHVTEIQSDVTGISEDIKTVLNGDNASAVPVIAESNLSSAGPVIAESNLFSASPVIAESNLSQTPLLFEITDVTDGVMNSSASIGIGEQLINSSQTATCMDVKGSESCDCIACQQKHWYETLVLPTLPKTPQDTKQKKCYICHERIANRDSHMKKYHPGQKYFLCSQCPMAYDDFKTFQKHKSTHKVALIKQHKAKRKSLKCYICFKRTTNLGRHMQKCHPGERAFCCRECLMTFDDYRDFQEHMSAHKAKTLEWCRSNVSQPPPKMLDRKNWKKCYICYERITHRERHMRKFHPGQKNYHCHQCLLEFDNYKDFQKHRSIHRVTAFKCDLCNRVYKSKTPLFEHIETHLNEKPVYMCHICGETFKVKNSLNKCKHGQTRKVPRETPNQKLRELKTLLNSSPILCQICGKSFSEPRSLTTHLYMHSIDINPKRPFKCEICGKRFALDYYLNKHMEIHKEICFTCETCNQSFSTMRQKKIHRSIYHKGETFNCFFCRKTFKEQKSLDQHLNYHTGEKPFACEVCNKRFPSLSGKVNHQYRVHRRGYLHFKCAICDKKFPSNFVRETHYLRAHSQEELDSKNIVIKRVECECGKLVRKEYLKRHRASHPATENFTCEICGKILLDLSSLERHRRCHLENGERLLATEGAGLHICDICGKSYSYASYLKQHKLLHSQDMEKASDSLKCNVCEKKFNCRAAVQTHKLLHTPNQGKNHVCDICGRAFRLKCLLKLHYTTHTGDQPHKCAVCGKGFLSKQSLEAHNRVHTKEKPFTCEVCGMSFGAYSNRRRHMILHTGEKPYQCDCCGKRFRQKGVMQVHRRIHTGEKPHECDICNKRFADPSTLAKHKAKHSKNTQISQPASICVL